MNLPNRLTVFRMILVPIFIIIGYIKLPGEFLGISTTLLVMDFIFIVASITDRLDGQIARKNNLVTNFGKFLDPIADKILVISALVMLVEFDKIPAWIPIVVITREFLVSGYRLIAVQASGKVIAANIWGKLKTVTQMVSIIMIFLDKYSFFEFVNNSENMNAFYMIFNIITSLAMSFSVVATIFSGWNYLKSGKDLLRDA